MADHDLFIIRSECPLCTATDVTELLSVPYVHPDIVNRLIDRYEGNLAVEDLKNASYTLLFCGTCRFVFQQYVPTDSLVQKLYSYQSEDRIKESFRKRTQSKSAYYSNNARFAERAVALTGMRPADISTFEYGAGWGYLSLMLKAFGMNVTALEVSKERCENLKDLNIFFVRKINMFSKKVDYGHSDQVFEHLPNPKESLDEFLKVVKKGGLVFIGVPNGNTIHKELKHSSQDYFIKNVYPLEHINCFSTHALITMAHKAGLERISSWQAFKKTIRHIISAKSIALLPDIFKFFLSQQRSTSIYFIKK